MNLWITKAGILRDIVPGSHAVEKKRGDVIRVSRPQGRRTWLGIEATDGKAYPKAFIKLRNRVSAFRRENPGVGIVAQRGDKVVECWPGDSVRAIQTLFT